MSLSDEFFVPDAPDRDPISEYSNGELITMKMEWLNIKAGKTNGERIPEYSLSEIQRELHRRGEEARSKR